MYTRRSRAAVVTSRIFEAQVQGHVSQLVLVVDKQGLLAVQADQVGGEMNDQGGRSHAALGPEEGDHPAHAFLLETLAGWFSWKRRRATAISASPIGLARYSSSRNASRAARPRHLFLRRRR